MMNVYIKSNKYRLYWLIDQYLAERINDETFCNEFHYCYNLEIDKQLLNKFERAIFDSIRETTDRFSPYDDPDVPDGVYTSRRELRRVAESAEKELLGYGWPTERAGSSTDMKEKGIKVTKTPLNVNKNARQWSAFIDTIPLKVIRDSISEEGMGINFVIPGAGLPVSFSGVREIGGLEKNQAHMQVDVAVPDIKFPEDNPTLAKDLILKLISDVFVKVESRNDQDAITVARRLAEQLQTKWDVSKFYYSIPEGLPYSEYEYSDGTRMGIYVEKKLDLKIVEHSLIIGRDGKEIL